MECIYKFKPNSIRSLFFSDNEINFLLTGFAKTALAKTLLSIAILWLIFGGHGLLAQNATISGTVSDLTGSPLPGASVQVKGTTLGSITDANGKYKVQASGGTILVISYIGYNSQEVVVGSRTAIDINLTPSAESLSEVVVVGYGSQKKADITGAVGSIKGSTLKTIVAGDAANLLQGQLAGVTVQSGGSAPGQAPAVVIRGSGTFGNDQPLYVIDGMIGGTMAFVNPNDIESIEVLKDASAAAIYGSRASNGVVLVTTKSGKAGEVKISFNARGGIQTPSKLLDMMNAKEYAAWNNLAHDNDKKVHAPVNQAYATGDNSRFDTSVDTDFQRLELSPAPMSDYNLSLSGGSNSAKYFISGGYFDQKGIAVDSWFKRYNMRANSIFTKGRFKFTESLSLSRSATNPNTYVGRETGPLPTMPVYDPKNDGGFAGLDPADAGVARVVNWYGLAQLNDNRITNDQALGNIGLEYEIIDGLKYKINLGLDYSSYRSFNFTPSFFFSNSQEAFQQQATLNDSHTTSFTTLIENTLNYTKSFGNHNFDVLTGYTSQQGSQNFLSASAANFPSNDLRVIDAAIDKTLPPSGNLQEFILRSFLGRINYNYKSKYLFTATIRRDASSKFLYPSNIFATFPSFSAGWKVSEEDFFPKNGLINDLKIRASYGSLGSQNIGNYLTAAVLNLNTDYYFAGGIQPGIGQTSFANRNLRWETTKTSDIGADMRLLNNTITISADYFYKKSFDILANVPIPAYGGLGGSLTKNAATISNKGFELAVTYDKPKLTGGAFNYSVTGSMSVIKNEVLSLGTGVSPIIGGGYTQQSLTATRTDVGQPVGSFWGYQVLGIYQTQQEVDADPNARNGAGPGDFIFSKDRTWLGSPFPNLSYGLNFNSTWKSFDMGMFWQGVAGNKIWNAKGRFQYILDYGSNKSTEALRAWTPDQPNTNIPRATQDDKAANKQPSDFYVENGSYLRLKNLTIGYTLPNALVEKAKIGSLRVYVSTQNLLTFTKYTGYDPEVGRASNGGNNPNNIGNLFSNGVDQTAYPNARIFNLGLDLNF